MYLSSFQRVHNLLARYLTVLQLLQALRDSIESSFFVVEVMNPKFAATEELWD
jgi:hypothetical protein